MPSGIMRTFARKIPAADATGMLVANRINYLVSSSPTMFIDKRFKQFILPLKIKLLRMRGFRVTAQCRDLANHRLIFPCGIISLSAQLLQGSALVLLEPPVEGVVLGTWLHFLFRCRLSGEQRSHGIGIILGLSRPIGIIADP